MGGNIKMNKKECENKILEKLKEIKDIIKKYDESYELYLNLTIIGDDYMRVNSRYYENIESYINVLVVDGRVIHNDN